MTHTRNTRQLVA